MIHMSLLIEPRLTNRFSSRCKQPWPWVAIRVALNAITGEIEGRCGGVDASRSPSTGAPQSRQNDRTPTVACPPASIASDRLQVPRRSTF